MPHVGGGSHGGGSHSSSSGTSSSAPRYDNSGRLHSTYYIRPGFYTHGVYVPYERNKRYQTLIPSIIMYALSVLLIVISLIMCTNVGKFDEQKLEEYTLEQYGEIYKGAGSYYEENILVTIVAYEDNKQFDYISIVGDNVNPVIDGWFGNDKTLFGHALLTTVPYENYYGNLYSYLATSVTALHGEWKFNKTVIGNTEECHIVNKTTFGDIAGETELKAAEHQFYNETGIHISFLVADAKEVYKLDLMSVGIMSIITVVLLGVGTFTMVKQLKANKEINQAIKDGNAAKYFEGEDDFETHTKNFPFGM